MTAPEKCEALRRAIINVVDLVELDDLSSEARVLFKSFDDETWMWRVCVTHPALELIAPGRDSVKYNGVAVFNAMISSRLADAIAGIRRDPSKPSLEEEHKQKLLQWYQHYQQQQLQQAQAAKVYQSSSSQLSGLQNSPLGSLGQLFGQTLSTTSGASNTP